METAEPLGFHDLAEDEALLVWLRRQWRSRGPTQAVAEHALAVLLRQARVHACLDELFALFGAIEDRADNSADGDRPLLNPQEERLIEMLANPDWAASPLPSLRRCRCALRRVGLVLRPSSVIPRSGHDRLELAIARSYATLGGMPAP